MELQQILITVTSLFVATNAALFSIFDREYAGRPRFCRSLDCPVYEKTGEGDGYEIRRYEASMWVSTNVMDMDYDDATRTGFMRLFRYIKGANVDGRSIAMTAPVINRIIPGEGPACESNFTISFFVPAAEEATTPAPTDPTVFITRLPEQTVFVKSFGGFARQEDWISTAEELSSELSGTYTFADYFYSAGYDSPFRFFNRHNEVWLIKTE